MVNLWRSEEMQRVRIMVPAEAAHETISALGDFGLAQFVDLNPNKSAFQRTYATEVKRCDEMARKLRFFKEQVEKAKLPTGARGSVKDLSLDDLEGRLEDLERELMEVNANSDKLQRTAGELIELQLVLEKAGRFFDEAMQTAQPEIMEQRYGGESIGAPLLEAAPVEPKVARLGFVAGLIETSKLQNFERLLFRATRGNMFLKQSEVGTVKDPATGSSVEKSVFVVFFAGDRARTKIMKICEVYGANRYPFPEEPNRQRQMYSEVTMRLRELQSTIDAGEKLRMTVLTTLAASLEDWCTRIIQEKATFHVMNKLSIDYARKVLVGEAWVPKLALPAAQDVLMRASESSHAQTSTILEEIRADGAPPTFFRTNKFTEGFQTIVDAYGVARYREVNPAVFTMATFPFLFAVMFGDLAHGIMMLMFALLLVLREKTMAKQQLNDMIEMLFGGRYVILMMSIFSIFVGLIYNEAFSIPMTLFGGTTWKCADMINNDYRSCGDQTMFNDGDTYPFGFDPAWRGMKTELTFTNSIKMKMSILLGVVHMDLGILMSLFNQTYFYDTLSLVCEFIPQMLFLNSLFGYLCFMLVYKWVSGSYADLYNVMINMFLSPGTIDEAGSLYSGQGGIQVFLVLIAFISVPWMLIPKPFVLKSRHNRNKVSGYQLAAGDDSADRQGMMEDIGGPSDEADHGDGHGGEFEFGEVMVHQMIHTIEFVLGAVSNTASYLRLWALTLAHSQLSAVFYERVILLGVEMGSESGPTPVAIIIMVVAFFVFAMATLGVLMVMESLSAFLHALRLHWVEFQNKFYQGDGYKFVPFAFSSLAKDDL
ncbi:hypothetical protein BSKO_04001 [Bryopsis sp. KO-2023]|nr:hypothetical protein BSKO_04001 [Bryopsis sp. KO-2023]